MKSFDILDKEPLQFARYHRHIAYFLFLVIYLAIVYDHNLQRIEVFSTISLIIVIPFIQNYFAKSLVRRRGFTYANNFVLFIDAFFISYWLIAVKFSIIPSLLAIIGLIYAAIWIRASWLTYFVFSLLISITLFSLSYLFQLDIAFTNTSLDISVLSILCFTIYLTIGLTYFYHRLHMVEKQKKHAEEQVTKYLGLANKLARYAPSQIWQSIMRGENEAQIDNKRKRLTIFFSDIQGFTELSEKLLPDDLAYILNDYFEHMSELAKRYGGTVDKFMGDAILIFFGDPDSRGAKEDATACVNMGLAMLQEMKILRNRWRNLGYEGLHVRIGINTGYCHVGNFGTSSRMSYTIVGREANLAARLQTAAEVDHILVSDSTYHLIKDSFTCIEKGELNLKGLNEPVMTWQIVARQKDWRNGINYYMDYELDGFNLQLDLQQLKSYEGAKAIQIMEQVTKRLKLEQQNGNQNLHDSR